MANNAQSSQSKSDNLGRGRVAYAFKVSRVNPDFVSFKVWILGYYSKVCSIAVASLPKIFAQIDTALAADEKLLKSIRKELSSYCCNVGVPDANHVPSAGKAAQPQPESLRSTKPKASAPVRKPSARQFCKITTTSSGAADFIAQSAPLEDSACGADASEVSDGLIQAFREALRAELAPIRAVLEELSFKAEELTVFAKGNSVLPLPESSFPRTRRGRTSVVVGVRKNSTLKNKNKEKMEDRKMFWLKAALCAVCGAFTLALCGCSSTTITETTYAADGSVAAVKVTESSESPLVIGIANTKDKHVVAHIGGWYGNIGVQPSSNSYGIGIGTLDNTYASVVASDGTKDGADVAAIFPAIVDASKYSLSITKDGAVAEGGLKAKTEAANANAATNGAASAQTEGK